MRTPRSQRSVRIAAALAIASGALVACNLLTGLDADYSSSAHDGATSMVSEGGTADAPSSDGQVGDGAMIPDGMVKPEPDAGLSAWCQSKRNGVAIEDFFCTDFEGAAFPPDGNPPLGWTGLSNDHDAGMLTFIDIDASRALDVKGTATAAAGAHTRLLKIMNATGKDAPQYAHYELQYDFRVIDATVSYAAIGLLVFSPYSLQLKEHGVAVYGGAPATLSQQGGPTALAKSVVNTGVWHHATVTLDRTGADTAYTRTILIDGQSVDGDTSAHTLDAGDPTDVSIGVFNGGAMTGTAHVQFDNVVFFRK